MTCTALWSFKAKERILRIQVQPASGSEPSLIHLAVAIIDSKGEQHLREVRQFGASELVDGVDIELVPATTYKMALAPSPANAGLVCNLTLSDGVKLVENQTCQGNNNSPAAAWRLVTWV